MNQLRKQSICLMILISASPLLGGATTAKIIPRSQSFNAARQMVGWNNPEWGINRYPQDESLGAYGSVNLTFEYTKTFRADRLTQSLFGDDLICGPCDDLGIKISGSAIADRDSSDWLADYFGLPRDFQSVVTFKPTISNFILDFSFYSSLWIDGVYFRIHSPFVHTRWSLNAQETVCSEASDYAYGSGNYFQGYFSDQVEPADILTQSFLAYANGAIPGLENTTWAPLCCSRINDDCACDALTRNGFAEVRFVLGYNFLNDEADAYHVGLGIYAAGPTGTSVGSDDCKGRGLYLFEPIVGNGKHWELGAQITGHHIWWQSADETKSLGLYLESNITHLFAARQNRCFDLTLPGSNSRYMLAQRFDANRNTAPRLNATTDPLGLKFTNQYAPVANLTRRTVNTSIAVQGDVALSLAYRSDGFQWDLGYNFWGRTCEDICIHDCCPDPVGFWALKGDQRVFGFESVSNLKVGMVATDSRATINQGSNMANGVDYTAVDPTDPVNAYADSAVAGVTNNSLATTITPGSAIALSTSSTPVFITEADFNLAGTRGSSNKIFTHFNWVWNDLENSDFTPYLGIGGEVEFGTGNNSCAPTCKDESCDTGCATNCYTSACDTQKTCTDLPRRASVPGCIDVALSQWGIWFKIGTSYN